MINLSELGRSSLVVPIWKKTQSLRDPDIYLAENIADYKENGPNLVFPWYKRFPSSDNFMDRAFISLMGVGIDKLRDKSGIEISNWFIVHDESGAEVMYWGGRNDVLPTIQTYAEAQEEQRLCDGDFVYDIFFRYLINHNLPNIIELRKFQPSNRQTEGESLTDRIRIFFPDYIPIPQPTH